MGTYRLILAVLVAISHMGVAFFGYNPGVVAVISFLIISGYVMTALVRRNYMQGSRIPAFYLDRALRLYPQFLFYFAVSCSLIYFFMHDSSASLSLTPQNIVLSLAIAPLNLWMFGITNPDILPPAWSLGLEAFFYLAIPFLIIYKAREHFYIASLIVFFFACLGFINTDFYGYRLLPGVLFIFLCGSYLWDSTRRGTITVVATWALSLLTLIAILAGLIPRAPFNTEVTAGIVIGVPAVWRLTRCRRSKVDEFLGNVSYGLFLNHFVVMYAADALGHKTLDLFTITAILFSSFLLSILTYHFIERPAVRMRHALRSRRAQNRFSAQAET